MVIDAERCACRCTPPTLEVSYRSMQAIGLTDISGKSWDAVSWGSNVNYTGDEASDGGGAATLSEQTSDWSGSEAETRVTIRCQAKLAWHGIGLACVLRYRTIHGQITPAEDYFVGEEVEVEIPADEEDHEIIVEIDTHAPPPATEENSHNVVRSVLVGSRRRPDVAFIATQSLGLSLSKVGFAPYQQDAAAVRVFRRETLASLAIPPDGQYSGAHHLDHTEPDPETGSPNLVIEDEVSMEGQAVVSPFFPAFAVPLGRVDTLQTRKLPTPPVELTLSDEYTTEALQARVDAYVEAAFASGGSGGRFTARRVLTPDEVTYTRREHQIAINLSVPYRLFTLGTQVATVRWKKRVFNLRTQVVTVSDQDAEIEITALDDESLQPGYAVTGGSTEPFALAAAEGTEVTVYDLRSDPVEPGGGELRIEFPEAEGE